jgi:hypothetical protein
MVLRVIGGLVLGGRDHAELAVEAAALNSRPRKRLGWKTPAEVLNDILCSHQDHSVATTP